MSSLSQFGGGIRPTKAIINATSTTGSTADTLDVITAGNANGTKKTVSGALTAGTLSTVISVTGAGVLTFFACQGADATSRTHRIKLTIDGVVAYDATTAAVAATFRGIQLIGSSTSASPFINLDAVFFNTSCLLEYASSVTETGKTTFAYTYRTF